MTIKKKVTATKKSIVKSSTPRQLKGIKKVVPAKKKSVSKKSDERKRNMPLVETLDRIENNSMMRKTEQACYVEKDSGKCLFCVGGTKNSVTPNDKQIKAIHDKGKKLIVTHNHPAPYNSSITDADLSVCINNDSAGVRAITKRWTYVVMRPKGGWKTDWYEAQKVYQDIFKRMERDWNNKYQSGKISKFYYEDNLTHKVMEKVANKLGFIYFRFRN